MDILRIYLRHNALSLGFLRICRSYVGNDQIHQMLYFGKNVSDTGVLF